MTVRECDTCGFSYVPGGPGRSRWCADCRPESSRRAELLREIPNQRGRERVEHALALAVVEQRLHIVEAAHALAMAAWSRQLGWDDTTHLQAALDALATTPTASTFRETA